MVRALAEQKRCMREVYALAHEIVRPPAGCPPEFAVRMGEVPRAYFTARRNLFSTLFYSTYLALGVARPRRLLYGKMNHLFRIWVTSADNLLDDEDKCVLPLEMPGRSRVMREVVTIMAADRLLRRILGDAVAEGHLTSAQADVLADESLRCLLPSAGQEAGEEGGIGERPEPQYVLDTIHVLKTGLLFNISFLGIDFVETGIDRDRVARMKQALMTFGGGCQILDDVRDLARDFVEQRHNYLLSTLARSRPETLQQWARRDVRAGDRLYFEVLPEAIAAARLGYQRLLAACALLQEEGVIVSGAPIAQMAFWMLTTLDLEDLAYACAFI